MDRGYNDYTLFGRWISEGVDFVTRMKESTAYSVIKERPVPQNRNIVSNEVIELVNVGADAKCPHLLRRVVVFNAEKEHEIVLLTNHLDFGSTTISAIYRDRWKSTVCSLRYGLSSRTVLAPGPRIFFRHSSRSFSTR